MLRHTGEKRSYSHNIRLALLLSTNAGFINAAGFLAFSVLTTNVTGHAALLALHVASADFRSAGIVALWLFLFLLGAFSSSLYISYIGKKQGIRVLHTYTCDHPYSYRGRIVWLSLFLPHPCWYRGIRRQPSICNGHSECISIDDIGIGGKNNPSHRDGYRSGDRPGWDNLRFKTIKANNKTAYLPSAFYYFPFSCRWHYWWFALFEN